MGAIMEREQSYKDAAEHYEKAWRHENQQSAQVSKVSMFGIEKPVIGTKDIFLRFCYSCLLLTTFADSCKTQLRP